MTQFTGGAELLAFDSANDFSLLQFNEQIGSYFSGWTTGTVAANTSVVGIHHPSGDLKKWSAGNVTTTSGGYHRVVWTQGTTEGGSSGSGLFDAAERLRGVLSGGGASCSSPSSPDWYGRFDQIFPSVKQWLVDGATVLSTDWSMAGSVEQGKWREYKITAPAGSPQMYVELFDLSNEPTSMSARAREQRWAPTTAARTAPERRRRPAASPGSGTTTWYIGVRGYSAGTTSYRVRATYSSK